MKFSIVIPAFNEAACVHCSIDALKAQDIDRNNFEIIVVDNNSTDETFEAASRAGADKVVKELTKGTNPARQRGFEESSGEIVAFLDADSEPPPTWLRKIEADLKKPGVAAVSGPFDYQFPGLKGVLDGIYTRQVLPRIPKIMRFLFRRKAGVLIGGNFAAWRSTIEKIGGLPPLSFWGDDVAIAMLISRRVGQVVFDPEVKVKSSPRRFEKSGFFKLWIRYISAYLRIYFSPDYV
jgi:glycosyltransferase involved in cell wall biosynthesis